MGKGVYTSENLKRGIIIEMAPVIVMNAKDRTLLDQTLLHDYIFEWGDKPGGCCMALGYVPLYNHSFNSNCEYEMEYAQDLIRITTVRKIEKGEELFINYNGTHNNASPLWFDTQ